MAAAHAIHNGLTVIPATHKLYHGEKVAFGTIVQLVLENAPAEEIEEVIHFCLAVGLPTTLAELGIKTKDLDALRKVAEASCGPNETIHCTPGGVDPDMVYSALLAADALGNFYKIV